MKLLVVGKNNLMKWPQTVVKFSPADETELFIYNAHTFAFTLHKLFGKKARNAYAAKCLEKRLKEFAPDLVLFVSPFLLPLELFEVLEKFPDIRKAGWQGDSWRNKQDEAKKRAGFLDDLFVTDTGFLDEAADFDCKKFYLPLCVDETVFVNRHLERDGKPFFVGVSNPKREEYLAAVQEQCVIYGKGWDTEKLRRHEVHNQTLDHAQVEEFVSRSKAPINMAFSTNNVNGLNFRTFEIPATGGLILVNKTPDLELNYDIGTQAVTYSTPEELNAIVTDLMNNPEKYEQIAKNGYEKTMASHTYAKRLEQMLAYLKMP